MEVYLHVFSLQFEFRFSLSLFWVCSTEGCSAIRLRRIKEEQNIALPHRNLHSDCPVVHAFT